MEKKIIHLKIRLRFEGYEVDKKDFNLVKTDKILMFILKKSTIFLFIKSLFNLSNMKFI